MPDKKTRGVSNLPVAIPDVPDAPTVSASNVGTARAYNNGAATVSISSPTGGLPSSYSITTSPSTVTTTATSSPVTISGLSSATSYTATVTPSNVSATGAASTTSTFTATTVPQAPTIGTFTDGGTGTTGTLSFTAGATGGSAITGYTYSTDGTNYSAASGTTSPLSLTGLSVGTYTFYLKATNANGTSLASTGVSGTVVSPSSYESIATVTVGSGGSSDVTFSSISSTYKHLQIRGIYRYTTALDILSMQLNGDTAANYSSHKITGSGSSAGVGASSSVSKMDLGYMMNSSTGYGATVIDLLDYTNTAKAKTVRALSGTDLNGSGYITLNSSAWYKNTSSVYPAINSIKIYPDAGTFAEFTQFALYGIRGA